MSRKRTTRHAVAVAVGALLGIGAPAAIAENGVQVGSTFKRVKVGETGPGGKRITVQIDAAEQAKILAANPAVPPRPETPADTGTSERQPEAQRPRAAEGSYAWYWERVAPDRAAASSGRLDAAVAALRQGPDGSGVRAPRLATFERIVAEHGPAILAATAGRDVSPALALAVIAVESAGRVEAVSSAGAAGLMQLMPATAERFGVGDRMDPARNVQGGVAYLEWLLDEFGRDVPLALAGYNAGEGAVREHDGVPPYAETRDYVPKVLAAWEVARTLCLTPPQLVSDGCVFRSGTRLARGD